MIFQVVFNHFLNLLNCPPAHNIPGEDEAARYQDNDYDEAHALGHALLVLFPEAVVGAEGDEHVVVEEHRGDGEDEGSANFNTRSTERFFNSVARFRRSNLGKFSWPVG